MRRIAPVLLVALAAACAPSSSSDGEVSSSDLIDNDRLVGTFARLGEVAPGSLRYFGILGQGGYPAMHAPSRYEPLVHGCEDVLVACDVSFLDVEKGTISERVATTPWADSWSPMQANRVSSWNRSADGTSFFYYPRKRTSVGAESVAGMTFAPDTSRAPMIVTPGTGARPLPLAPEEGAGAWRAHAWAGNETIALQNDRKVIGVDAASGTTRWTASLLGFSEPSRYATTTDGAILLVYTKDLAQMGRTADNTEIPIESWATIPAPSCGDDGPPVVTPFAKGFRIQRGKAGGPATLATLGSDGSVTVHDRCVRAFAEGDGGAFAFVTADRIVTASADGSTRDYALPDGTAVSSVFYAGARNTRLETRNASNELTSVTRLGKDARALAVPKTGVAVGDGARAVVTDAARVELVDLATGARTLLYTAPANASRLRADVEPDVEDASVAVTCAVPCKGGGGGCSDGELVDLAGNRLGGVGTGSPLGWSQGVFYDQLNGTDVRAFTRDGKQWGRVIVADEMIIHRTGDPQSATIQRIVVRKGTELSLYTTRAYVAPKSTRSEPAPQEPDDDDITTPKKPVTSEPAGPQPVAAASAGGCSSAPSPGGASGACLLALALVAARRKTARRSG